MTASLNDVIAERRLDFKTAENARVTLVVRLSRPEADPEPGGAWRCAFEINGGAASLGSRQVSGEDSYQALVLALELIHVEVEHEVRQEGLSPVSDDVNLELLPRRL